MKDIFKTDRLKKMQYRSHEVVPKLRFIGLCDRGALRHVRLCLTTPPFMCIKPILKKVPFFGIQSCLCSIRHSQLRE